MRLRNKTAVLIAGIVSAVGFIVWPGCATPPLPTTRHPIAAFKPADLKFVNAAHPSRTEVVAKLGVPDESFPEFSIVCYKLNRLARDRIALLFGILPITVWKDPDRIEVALIQFDEHDQAQRMEIKIVSAYVNLRPVAMAWIAK